MLRTDAVENDIQHSAENAWLCGRALHRVGFSGVGDAVCEEQRILTLEKIADQTRGCDIVHLALRRSLVKHLRKAKLLLVACLSALRNRKMGFGGGGVVRECQTDMWRVSVVVVETSKIHPNIRQIRGYSQWRQRVTGRSQLTNRECQCMFQSRPRQDACARTPVLGIASVQELATAKILLLAFTPTLIVSKQNLDWLARNRRSIRCRCARAKH